METSVRLAVVGPVPTTTVGALRALPQAPEVRVFASLYGDSEPLLRFQPDLLVVALENGDTEAIGALRLLRSMHPTLAIVLATEAADEVARAPLASRIGAHLLVQPERPGHLAATIEQALQGSNRPRADVFLDLAHGLADEVNNPLLFVAGHLQLLLAGFDPVRERDRRDQVTNALDGLRRIQASVDRLRLVSQAAAGPKRVEAVDVAELLGAGRGGLLEARAADCVVQGDREHLTAAFAAIRRFRDDLEASGARAVCGLERIERGVRLRLVAAGSGIASWRLPQSFEPYYPNRVLRGHGLGHGLDLFVAQTVVLGHRGQATARRLGDGSLQFDFVLPV